ncbi:MAG: zinc ribbon domain-containing protein [Clostridia bacterium]|nr:zinc ribbon domain-containing protein [Clostridia bacterium]
MYCRHCGKEVEAGTKFCRFCGGALSGTGTNAPAQNIAVSCPACGAVPPVGAKFCNKCGYPMQQASGGMTSPIPPQISAQSPRQKRTKQKSRFSGFMRAVALLLVAAILVTGLWKPGFMLPWIEKIGISKPANPQVEYNTDSLKLDRKEIDKIEPQVFDVNEDETLVTAGDITVDLGTLEGEHTLEIRDVGKKHDNSLDASVTVWDFRIDGGKTQPDGFVKITVPYDPTNDDPLDTITLRTYDDKTKTWTTLPAEFDTDAKTVSFWTDHFSGKGLFDTTDSRIANKEYVHGAIADGTLELAPGYQEYKTDGTGFDLSGAASGAVIGSSAVPTPLSPAGAAIGFYIGGKMAEWNNDEAFLYNQEDIQEGKGALTRVTFNANRLTQISKNITTQFDTLKTIAQQENNWQEDPTVAGKSAVVLGFVGNGATATDNIQQILSSMGMIAEGTSKALAKKFFAVGIVLTGIKFVSTWYENGSFTSALKDNAADIGLIVLGAISLATPTSIVAGVAAAGLWALTATATTDKDHITALRNGHYDNDTQKAYMVFTTNYIAYSQQADRSGKWPGGLTFAHLPASMEKTRDYLFNTYKTNGFPDTKPLVNERHDKELSQWRNYLNLKAYKNSQDTAQLSENLDACFTNAAGVFWRLPKEVRQEFAKDIKAYDYKEPDSDTIGTYKEQMKQVLTMLNTGNIEYFYKQYETQARGAAMKSIDELTNAMNTVTSFSFYVMESDGGKAKKVPLAETQYKGYIAAFCTGTEAAPKNAAYGILDDWIFKTGEDKVQFQCTAYNWLKAGEGYGGSLNYVRLFKDEKALKYNESSAEASFEFANGGVEVIFGGLDELEGEYTGTITPTGVYLGDLWYKVWGEQFGLSRETCDDSVSIDEGVRITGVKVEKSGGILSSGKYKLIFHITDENGKKVETPVNADYKGGQFVIKNDKGTTAITVIQEAGKPTRLTGTGVVLNFNQTEGGYSQIYWIIDIDASKIK